MTKSAKPVFYVYALFRPDGRICYIGKGTGDRINKHEREARKGRETNRHLANIIRAADGCIPKVKIKENITEAEAFDIEIAFIAALVIERDGGPLVNLTYGGEGPSGMVHSEESRRKISDAVQRALENGLGEKLSIAQQARWDVMNLDERIKFGATMVKAFAQPGVKEKHAAGLNEYWETADREEHGRKVKAGYTEETSQLKSKASLAMWDARTEEVRAEFTERNTRNSRANWADGEPREKMLTAIKQGWENEDRRKNAGSVAAKNWADPEIRERMLANMRIGQQRRRARELGELNELTRPE